MKNHSIRITICFYLFYTCFSIESMENNCPNPSSHKSEKLFVHFAKYSDSNELNDRVLAKEAQFVQAILMCDVRRVVNAWQQIPVSQRNSSNIHRKATAGLLKTYGNNPDQIINVYEQLKQYNVKLRSCDSQDMAAIAVCIDPHKPNSQSKILFLKLMGYYKQVSASDDYNRYTDSLIKNFVTAKTQLKLDSADNARNYIIGLIQEATNQFNQRKEIQKRPLSNTAPVQDQDIEDAPNADCSETGDFMHGDVFYHK